MMIIASKMRRKSQEVG